MLDPLSSPPYQHSAPASVGAPRIHGELLKLGIEVSEATVSKYLAPLPKPPSQTWRTFPGNHAKALASIDFFVLPSATFRLLMVFTVPHHERRQLVHFGVMAPRSPWQNPSLKG